MKALCDERAMGTSPAARKWEPQKAKGGLGLPWLRHGWLPPQFAGAAAGGQCASIRRLYSAA